MYRRWHSAVALGLVFLGAAIGLTQSRTKLATNREATGSEDFAAAIKRIRETWVQEFNAGHADKVAALYAQEAVLMRRNGSVHNRDSIQTELERSISDARGHYYSVESLQTEHTVDLGYDIGIYNEDFPRHIAEGNYLMVVKKIDGEWKIVAHAAVPNPRMK